MTEALNCVGGSFLASNGTVRAEVVRLGHLQTFLPLREMYDDENSSYLDHQAFSEMQEEHRFQSRPEKTSS